MVTSNMTEERAAAGFAVGIDCAPAVFAEMAPQIGMDRGTAIKVASGFGGGMWRGDTCGCVTGAIMAIGLRYGTAVEGDKQTKAAMLAKKAEFEKKFIEMYGSCICREILGYDLSTPEGMAKIQEEKLLTTLCPKIVCDTCEILEGIL